MHRSLAIGSVAISSCIVAFGFAEVIARLWIPPPQFIEFSDAKPIESAADPVVKLESNVDILPIMNIGPLGVRYYPNRQAMIRNHRLSHKDILIETNGLGLRYPELQQKTNDEFRVLVFGDSIVTGDYVQAAETITGYMEEISKNRGKKLRFINAGLPGANALDELHHYREVKQAVNPDLVVVGLYLNDSQFSGAFYTKPLPPPLSRSRVLSLSWLTVQGLLHKRAKDDQGLYNSDRGWFDGFRNGRDLKTGNTLISQDALDYEVYNAPDDFGLAWNPQSWEIISNIMSQYKTDAAKDGTPLAIFLFPVAFQVSTQLEERRPQEMYLQMCQRLQLNCYDLLPELRKDWVNKNLTISTQDFFYDHCHYTPQGNAIVAGHLLNWLDNSNQLPK